MNSSKVVIPAGSIIACPKCLKPQLRLDTDLCLGQKLDHWRFKEIEGSAFKVSPHAMTISYCCSVSFFDTGNLFIERKGWLPHKPPEPK